jgi:predicted CoA-binding protein
MKRTLVLGASENPDRYSNKAIVSLTKHGHEVLGLGNKEGEVAGVKFGKERAAFEKIDTVTMYLGKKNQEEYYSYILDTIQPKRIIFNPGAENEDLAFLANKKGIKTENACTLVLLSIGQY